MASVDQITENVAATSLKDPAAVAETVPTASNDAVSAIVAEGRRVYIGNLAYATTDKELQDFFKGFLVLVSIVKSHPCSKSPGTLK